MSKKAALFKFSSLSRCKYQCGSITSRSNVRSSSHFACDWPPFVDDIKASMEQTIKANAPHFQSKWSFIPRSHSLVQQPAPDFTAKAVYGDNSIKDLTLSSFRGKSYVLLFFYPLDFTFVCPTGKAKPVMSQLWVVRSCQTVLL